MWHHNSMFCFYLVVEGFIRNTALWLLYYRFSPENTDLLTTLGLLYLQVLKTVSYYMNLIIKKMSKIFFL